MSILNVQHVSHSYGGREIFEDVSFRLLKGEHVALVGANGEGKTTFLSILTGKLTPDAGTVEWARRTSVGYLDQHASLVPGMTIRETLRTAFDTMMQQEKEMLAAYDKMSEATPEEMDKAYLAACLFAMRLEQVAIDYLTPVAKGDGPRARAAKILAGEHRAALASIKGRLEFTADGGAGATGDGAAAGVPQGPHAHEQFAHARMYADEVNAGALSIELDVIRRMAESGEIDRDVAHRLREDVYLRQMSLEG